MPDFDFMKDAERRDIAQYLFYLGDRTAAERMVASPAPYQRATPPKMAAAIPSNDPSMPPQGWPTFIASPLYGGTLILTPANFKEEPFRDMPDDQWFWHVSEGVQGSVMPPWRESLSNSQRWAVIRYVQQVYARPFERDPNEGKPPAAYQKT